MQTDLTHQIHDLIVSGERQAATELIEAWADTHGYERALAELLEPTLKLVGDKDLVSLAEGFVAACVANDVMERALGALPPGDPGRERQGPVIIGNIEDDYHALGRRLVATALRIDGWDVIDLGNDVPPHEFVDKAVETRARVIGVSAMIASTARNVRGVREELDRRSLSGKIQLAVGGAIFNAVPAFVSEVGADGTAPNAFVASRLISTLWAQSLETGGDL